MSNECAVCYVTDLRFLLPSLVSAQGVRRFISADKADLFIFTVGVEDGAVKEADRLAAPMGMRVMAMSDEPFKAIDRTKLLKPDTPMAMFGRFFMHEFLPASCTRIVYLDGDTWIARDPSPLIEAQAPDGRFAAAEDTISLRQRLGFGYTTKQIRGYFYGLGLAPEQGYFNSGVIVTGRATWKTIAQEGFHYYLGNMAACQYSQDQCALNAVAKGRRVRLSHKWNFQTQLKFWGADRYVTPHIYHFNRYPKPWMGPCTPWAGLYEEYKTAIAPFAPLNLPLKKLGAGESAAINADNAKKYGYLKLPFVSRTALAVMGYRDMEQNAWLG